MRTHIYALSLAMGLVCFAASPTSGSVSSTTASYNGNALVLNGKVTLDHGLGKMQAEEAELQKQEEPSSDFPFKLIHLAKEVLLSLKNNAQVKAEQADLDFSTLKGFLVGGPEGRVSYTDYFKKKAAPEHTLSLLSETMELTFAKETDVSEKTHYGIESALARGNTRILYGDLFTLDADHALYRKELSNQDKTATKEFQGILTAYPKDDLTTCHLCHGEDHIDAHMVDIDLLQSKISLLHPTGKLTSSLLSHGQEDHLTFEAKHLTWDHKANRLTLKGDVTIVDPTLGTLTATQTVELSHQLVKGKRILQTAVAQGPTTLVYQNQDQSQSHTLTCLGTTRFDHAHQQATCESPEVNGSVAQTSQVHYEDGDLSFYADIALFEYAEEDKALSPTSFTLKGNVRLFSKDPHQKSSYGIADRLHYAPETHTLILTASPGKKVLFWDEVNQISLSAKEVHILQDPATKERKVQGVGNLRMTFDPSEHALFKQLFPGISLHD